MGEIEIKNFASMFSEYLKPGTEVINIVVEKLPQAGYGSTMVKADVTIKTKTGTLEHKYVVVKLVPTNEMIKKMFQIESTFKNEVAFYKTVLPTLKNFQKQQGIAEILDIFPEFYGARLSLDKEEVDNNAVLILENLITTGTDAIK